MAEWLKAMVCKTIGEIPRWFKSNYRLGKKERSENSDLL